MANYEAVSRTNYFRVTDEEKYQKLFSNLVANDDIYDFTETKDGATYHGFGSYSSISYRLKLSEPTEDGNEYDYDFDKFLYGIQDILPDDEAFIYFEVGNEKLRYVNAYAFLVTKEKIDSVDLDMAAKELVQEILGKTFETRTCY